MFKNAHVVLFWGGEKGGGGRFHKRGIDHPREYCTVLDHPREYCTVLESFQKHESITSYPNEVERCGATHKHLPVKKVETVQIPINGRKKKVSSSIGGTTDSEGTPLGRHIASSSSYYIITTDHHNYHYRRRTSTVCGIRVHNNTGRSDR